MLSPSCTEKNLISINEDWFDAFINNSPAVAWITDEHGNIAMMNNVFKEVMGLDKETGNKSIWELFPADMASIFHKNNMEVLRTNEILRTEEISIDKFGNTKLFIVYKFPVTTKD